MILHFYIAKKFLWIFLGLTTVFTVLIGLIDFVENLRRFAAVDVGFSDLLLLTLLNTPAGLYQILPLLMILSTVTLFLGLARSSELVITRAIGRSGLTTLIAPALVALLIGLLTLSTGNPIVAATSKRFTELSEEFRNDGRNALSISGAGIWLRQGSADGQTVIHAERSDAEGRILFDVDFIAYAPDGGPVRRIVAKRAELTAGAWRLTKAKVWPLISGINSEANSVLHDELFIPSSLTREKIRDSLGEPSAISVWDLPAFIADLQEAGFSSRRHLVWLHSELALPLFLISMVLIAAAFTMRHTRLGGAGIAVMSSILLGFGLYYVRNFAQILGENGQIPHLLAAWVPPVASVMLAVGVLLHMEDG